MMQRVFATVALIAVVAIAALAITNGGGRADEAAEASTDVASDLNADVDADGNAAASEEPVAAPAAPAETPESAAADTGKTPESAAGDTGETPESAAGDTGNTGDTAESADAAPTPKTEPSGPMLDAAPPILGVEAELTDIDGWLQSEINSLADLDGTVHIVQFWTFGCYNCKNTLPTLIHINETYGDQNFEIVGVHSPEFDREKDPVAIQEAADTYGVTWPIALDTDKTNFRSWQGARRFWPRTYVVDQEGNIRFDRIGEGAYEELEATVAYLLEHGASTEQL